MGNRTSPPDPNADLIGYTFETGHAPDASLRITGTTAYSTNHVYCDLLNVYGEKIGETARAASLIRQRKATDR